MINNYNEFVTEKLTDNLKGFDADEIRNQFLNDEIEYKKYIQICKKNNIKINVEDFKQKFLSGEVDIDIYINLCKDYNYELPSSDIIHTLIKNSSNFQIMLFYACKYNFIDLIEYSIKNGADINWETKSYIVQIIKNNNIDALKLMIDNGAKISTEIIQYAKRCGYNEIADFLQNYYNNQSVTEKLTDNLKGFNEKELIQNYIDGKVDTEKFLLICRDYNFKPSNILFKNKIIEKKLNLYKYVIFCKEYNLEFFDKDELHDIINTFSPDKMLEYACEYGFLDLVETAIKKDENIHINNYSIKEITEKSYLDIIEYLLDKVDTSLILYHAIINDKIEVIKLLIEHHININKNVLQLCQSEEMKELIKKYINNND